MLIENKLNDMKLEIPQAPDHIKNELMKKISLITYEKSRKNLSLRKVLVAITSLVLIITVSIIAITNIDESQTISSGDDFGLGLGGGSYITFPGFVGLSTKKKSDISELVNFSFNYGHDYSINDFTSETSQDLIGHSIEVFVYDGKSGLNKFGDQAYKGYQKIYEKSFRNHDFLDNQYKILNETVWIWSKIKYQKGFDLEIDFNTIDIDSGRIVIKMSQITLYKYEENGDQLENQEIANRYAYLTFTKSENKVIFSK